MYMLVCDLYVLLCYYVIHLFKQNKLVITNTVIMMVTVSNGGP